MTATSIEWTDAVWNPTTGCDRVSPGCDNCYALTMAKRLKGMGSAKYQRDGDHVTSGPGFGLTMHPDVLTEPFRWRKPRRVFVNSMSDLFHKDVTDEFIARAFAVMALTPAHTYQVLTKRHGRLRALLSSNWFREAVFTFADEYTHQSYEFAYPLANVWLGVSAENQKWADIRVPALLDTPAAVRFVSAEPLLGEINFHAVPGGANVLDWIIVGGESGLNHRPIDADWVRSIRNQCIATRTPFFFKQWGGIRPKVNGRELDGRTWGEMPA